MNNPFSGFDFADHRWEWLRGATHAAKRLHPEATEDQIHRIVKAELKLYYLANPERGEP